MKWFEGLAKLKKIKKWIEIDKMGGPSKGLIFIYSYGACPIRIHQYPTNSLGG